MKASERQQKIFDYFGVNSWSEVVEQIEKKIGDSLYDMTESDERYDIVKFQLQKMVKEGTLVQ